jgi:hypothetical protein
MMKRFEEIETKISKSNDIKNESIEIKKNVV